MSDTSGSKQRYQSQSTRHALLRAAQICIRRNGYQQTTARDVTAESGANLRSIGYHYGGLKPLLIHALNLNYRAWMTPLIASATGNPADTLNNLNNGLARFNQLLTNNEPMIRAWIEAIAESEQDPQLRAQLTANQTWLRTTLTQTLKSAKVEEPAAAAQALITVCDGLMIQHLLHRDVPAPSVIANRASNAIRTLNQRKSTT